MDITTAPEEVTISRKKLYCFARMYQSLESTGNPFAGCQYCKIKCSEINPYKSIKDYMRKQTGVSLSLFKDINTNLALEHNILPL
jgi:hypothetical protein